MLLDPCYEDGSCEITDTSTIFKQQTTTKVQNIDLHKSVAENEKNAIFETLHSTKCFKINDPDNHSIYLNTWHII